jgi:signal transduction histidine kinase
VVSRLDAGALTPRSEPFRAEPVLRRAWDALRAKRPFSVQTIGEPHLAVGDPDRLEQVIWAVIDNAVKYSEPGTPVTVQVSARPGPNIEIAIRDRGYGMDVATISRAFDQFYRSDAARSRAPDGSGIGLYAAAGLMAAMNGSIEAASKLGEGTQITLTLPAEPAGIETDV